MQIENQLAQKACDETGAAGADQEAQQQGGVSSEDGEFRLTVKKLEMAVRPRGVLAE